MNSQILSKERVLIVGFGDVGMRTAQCLSADLYSVIGIRRDPTKSPVLDDANLTVRACDATNAEQLANVLQEGFAVIIITMTPPERSDAGYQRAYVQTCKNLISELKSANQTPRLIIFVSSTAVYHQMDGGWVDETSPAQPDGFSGKRLLEAEQVIQNSGFNHVVLRFSGIYGPGRNRLINQVQSRQASASEHFTNRIHADDCARAIVHLIELDRQKRLNESLFIATDSAPAPMVEVVNWLAEQLGVDDFLSPQATNERGNKRCSNARLVDSGFVFKYPTYKDGYAELLKTL